MPHLWPWGYRAPPPLVEDHPRWPVHMRPPPPSHIPHATLLIPCIRRHLDRESSISLPPAPPGHRKAQLLPPAPPGCRLDSDVHGRAWVVVAAWVTTTVLARQIDPQQCRHRPRLRCADAVGLVQCPTNLAAPPGTPRHPPTTPGFPTGGRQPWHRRVTLCISAVLKEFEPDLGLGAGLLPGRPPWMPDGCHGSHARRIFSRRR